MIFVFLLLVTISLTQALPQGAPSSVCQTMLPFHGGGIPPQTGIPPYSIIARRQGGNVMVSITSSLGVPFQGFLLQGRTPRRELLGEFDLSATANGEAHTLDCGEPGDSITHNSPSVKEQLDVLWKPPQGFEGPVIFK